MEKIWGEKRIAAYRRKVEESGLLPPALLDVGEWFRIKKEETVLHQGDDPAYFLYIFSGTAQVCQYLPNGKLLTIHTLQAPCTIGEMELLEAEREAFQVTAKTELLAFGVEMERAKKLLLADAAFLRKLCVIITEKERSTIAKLTTERGYSTLVRLARFILDNSVEGVYSVRKVDTAALLGVSYRHLGQLFYELKTAGYLEKRGTSYLVRDEAGLRKVSEELPSGQFY